MSDEELTPVQKLERAVQEFVNETGDHPRIVQSAVLVYEAMRFDDEGDVAHKVAYSVVTGSVAGAAGLLKIGSAQVIRDVVDYDEDDDD